MRLKIIKGDTTSIKSDAIVSSTNRLLLPVTTVDAAIRRTAGINLANACSDIGSCEVGKCVVTKGFNLPCQYLFHTAVPNFRENASAKLLAECYANAIQMATTKRCSSVAFPLLGLESLNFPVETAVSIALATILRCMQKRKDGLAIDLLIILVLPDDNTKAMAITRAKGIIGEEYLEIDDDCINTTTGYRENGWISLCKVNKPDRNSDTWLLRLADVVDGSLVSPTYDESKEQIFDNRRLIFREDGPISPDELGFWEWKERKNDAGRWWTKASFLEDVEPIEIIVLNNPSSVDEIINVLKAGVYIKRFVGRNLVFAIKQNGLYMGVSCVYRNFKVLQGESLFVALRDDVYTLPYYEFRESDIFTWGERKVYKYIALGNPIKQIPAQVPLETLKQLFLQRMTWPAFKAQGITKGDWQKIKQFLNEIPDRTLLETVSQTYGLSAHEAQHCVESFLRTIEAHINVEDVDSELVVQMLDHHEGLKQTCYSIAERKWQEEHQTEVEQAQEEIVQMRNDAEQEVLAAKQNLEDINKSITDAKAKHEGMLTEIAASQTKLDQIMADIEQYETLGTDTMEAVRQKISEAQRDMAGFLADMSVFLPQQQSVVTSDSDTPSWKYVCAENGCYAEKDADESETYHDELNAISQNLTNCLRVDSAFSNMLSAFLYAAHINQVPVMIAGPAGGDLAEIMSVSLYGNGAGQLMLGDRYDSNIVTNVKGHCESIVSVQNMFGKGWNDGYPQMFNKFDKQVIWTHPYVEDLAIEPKGLYNYMIPILSECFVGMLPAEEPWPGKRAEKFKPYVSKKQTPLRISAFKRLGLSRLLLNRLTQVLSDTKAILNSSANDRDLEVLFGLLPLCVLTGRTDILKEVIESENGISAAVKAEARRYIEEV